MSTKKKWDRRNTLTPEKALEMLRKQLAPRWIGSAPLLAAVPAGPGGALLSYPMDPQYSDRPWLVTLVDPGEVTRAAIIDLCLELKRRYEPLKVSTMAIVRSQYPSLNERPAVEALMQRTGMRFPVAIDADGNLGRILEAPSLPRLLYLTGGKRRLESEGTDFAGFEARLQALLREEDPGLPLLPPYRGQSEGIPTLAKALELGTKLGKEFPPAGIQIEGEWERKDEFMVTSDRKARIRFKAQGKGFFVVAQSMARVAAPATVLVQVQGGPARPSEGGADLTFDHEGISKLPVNVPGLYHVLAELPPSAEVALTFPDAAGTPVALYSLRFQGA